MAFLILLIGIFILSTCLAFFVSPSLVDELIRWLGDKRHLNYVVVLRLVLGVVLLLGASYTDYPLLIAGLGVLFIAAGMLLYALPADQIQRITGYFLERPAWVVRAWVLVPAALGAFILYAVL